MFSRRLDQDQYICLGHTSSRRFQNALKTSPTRLAKMSSRHLQDVFKTFSSCLHLQDVFKRLQNVLQKCLQDISSRGPQDILKMSSRRFPDFSLSSTVLVNRFSRCLRDVFKTFLRRTPKTIIYSN